MEARLDASAASDESSGSLLRSGKGQLKTQLSYPHPASSSLTSEEVDEDDGRSNQLLRSCPFFHNELGGDPEWCVSFCSTTSTASTSTSFSRSTSPAHQYLRRESVRIPSGDMGSATSETILELLKSSSTVLAILSLKPPAPKGLSLRQSLGRRFA